MRDLFAPPTKKEIAERREFRNQQKVVEIILRSSRTPREIKELIDEYERLVRTTKRS